MVLYLKHHVINGVTFTFTKFSLYPETQMCQYGQYEVNLRQGLIYTLINHLHEEIICGSL